MRIVEFAADPGRFTRSADGDDKDAAKRGVGIDDPVGKPLAVRREARSESGRRDQHPVSAGRWNHVNARWLGVRFEGDPLSIRAHRGCDIVVRPRRQLERLAPIGDGIAPKMEMFVVSAVR